MRSIFDGGYGGAASGPDRFTDGLPAASWRRLLHVPHLVARMLSACLESERSRWFNWIPVNLAAGMGIYFSLRDEPSVPLLALVAAAAALCGWRHLRAGSPLSGAMFFLAAGFLVAALRTAAVSTPPFAGAERRSVMVTGWVETIETRENGARRLTLRPVSVESLDARDLPRRVRVVDRHKVPLAPGMLVTLRARLYAPPGPAMPGGHDFARDAWFRGIGAVGYTIGTPEQAALEISRPFAMRMLSWIERVRNDTTAAIIAAVPGPAGHLIAALVTGQRSALPEDVLEAMRAAGLAHLLAISGLNMSLVAGTMFQILRSLLALFPPLVLRLEIKKWSAAGALLVAAGYLALCGAEVSAQRAFVMIAIMFIAVLVGRPAITMRNVALAAMAVMFFTPENVLNAGFQMSFATVIALVAFYDSVWRAPLLARMNGGTGIAARALRNVAGTAATTLVASLATAPISTFHFHTLAAYSLAGNLVAIPVVGFLVMPFALIGVLLLPFGLGDHFLTISAAGCRLIVSVAEWVAAWQGAVIRVPSTAPWTVYTMIGGGLWVCLWHGRWRVLGFAAVAVAFIAAGNISPPSVLIDRDGRNMAMRNADGEFVVMSARRSAFAVESWLAADGDRATPAEAAGRTGLDCDPLGCAGRTTAGTRLAFVANAAILAEECSTAQIVITPLDIDRRRCPGPAIVLARSQLARTAHSIVFGPQGPVVKSAEEGRGSRPWTARKTTRSR